jgi:hypothetical protein
MRCQDKKDKSFSEEVCEILKRKNYTATCYPLFHLTNSIMKNDKFVNNKVTIYKYLALPLLLGIPLISTYLSIVANMKGDEFFTNSLRYASVILTVMTVVNSIYRPRVRFAKSCKLEIKIEHFKSNFLGTLEKMQKIDEESLLAFESEQRAKFETYQEELITLFLPESGVEDIKKRKLDKT